MDVIFWTIDEILTATGGELVAGKEFTRFEKISIDSRNINKNDLFVAVEGRNHDGHRFIKDVIEKGVRGIVVDRAKYSQKIDAQIQSDVFYILVEDPIAALGDLAAFHRQRFSIPVICITGSNGKTTTKEMATLVLGQKFKTLKTLGMNSGFH